jgi:hypothetical protein
VIEYIAEVLGACLFRFEVVWDIVLPIYCSLLPITCLFRIRGWKSSYTAATRAP